MNLQVMADTAGIEPQFKNYLRSRTTFTLFKKTDVSQ